MSLQPNRTPGIENTCLLPPRLNFRIYLPAGDAVASRAVVPRKRDPRQAGIFDTPLPRFVRPQLAKLVTEAPEGERWAHELKFDGYRVLVPIGGRDHRVASGTQSGGRAGNCGRNHSLAPAKNENHNRPGPGEDDKREQGDREAARRIFNYSD